MPRLRPLFEEKAAFAFVELGLSEEEFFRQTPRQWQRRMEAWKLKERRTEVRVAKLCAVIAMSQGAQGATVEDFMPELVEQDEDQMTRTLVGTSPSIKWENQ